MHLLIPHASALDERCRLALADTPLPHLEQLLAWMRPEGPALGGDEYALNTPQDLALAHLRAWSLEDGKLPFAAHMAAQMDSSIGETGATPGDLAWALLSPIHLSIGTDQVTALPPEHLALTETESRALFDTLAELWPATEGWRWVWGTPQEWLLGHPSLADLATASLDRIALRSIEAWLPQDRLPRRLQNEAQMLLHGHPVNALRESQGQRAINSVWFSGCGRAQPCRPGTDPQVDDRLRMPLIQGDWSAWRAAWQDLDAGPLAQLLAQVRQGQIDTRLTLCGERWAQTYATPALGRIQQSWMRWRSPRQPATERLVAL